MAKSSKILEFVELEGFCVVVWLTTRLFGRHNSDNSSSSTGSGSITGLGSMSFPESEESESSKLSFEYLVSVMLDLSGAKSEK